MYLDHNTARGPRRAAVDGRRVRDQEPVLRPRRERKQVQAKRSNQPESKRGRGGPSADLRREGAAATGAGGGSGRPTYFYVPAEALPVLE